MQQYKQEWFGNIRGDILAGIVVCLALFPEVIGFMIVAGVPPIVGVYATFFITAIAAFFGSSKGMISAAAGSVALVLAHLVAEYGIQYLFAATILAGILQVALGLLKVGTLMRYIPKPVMTGFVNGLGIMMFTSQLDHFQGSLICRSWVCWESRSFSCFLELRRKSLRLSLRFSSSPGLCWALAWM